MNTARGLLPENPRQPVENAVHLKGAISTNSTVLGQQ